MPDDEYPFAIVYAPEPHGEPGVLRTGLNAAEVTMVFADELQRLQASGATGELMVYRTDKSIFTLRQTINATVEADWPG